VVAATVCSGTPGVADVAGALGCGVGVVSLGVTVGEGGASPESPESVSGGAGAVLTSGVGSAGAVLGVSAGGGAAPPASGMSSPPSLRSRNSLRATFQFSSR
jgi:hypothetical protein